MVLHEDSEVVLHEDSEVVLHEDSEVMLHEDSEVVLHRPTCRVMRLCSIRFRCRKISWPIGSGHLSMMGVFLVASREGSHREIIQKPH